MGYQVELLNFEGPLDLLLQLIERSKLSVTEIALATVTEQYLLYVESLTDVPPSELNGFLEVAAKLLHMKSQALLPALATAQTSEDSSELQDQLERYRQYQAAAKLLQDRLSQGIRSWDRLPYTGHAPSPPDVTLQQLHLAFKAALERLPAEPALVTNHTISLEKMMELVRAACQERLTTNLSQLTGGIDNRAELIVLFLALLELVRLKEIRVVQVGAFNDIMLGNEGEP